MKKRNILMIFVAVILLFVTSFVVYAAFTMTSNYRADVDYHEISKENSVTPSINTEINLSTPGEAVNITFNLVNVDTRPYNYYFSISTLDDISTNDSLSLYTMILVYQDNQFIGTLDKILLESNGILPNSKTIINNEQATISFELSNGSSSLPLETKSINLKITCKYETTNAQKYIYVKNIEELNKALDDANSVSGKTIVLTDNITTTADLRFINETAIDLNGKTLTLNNTISLDGDTDYNLTITDSRTSGVISGSGKFLINNAKAFVKFDIEGNNTGLIDQNSNYNQFTLLEAVEERINSIGYLKAADTYDLLGLYDNYLAIKDFSFTVDNNESNGTYEVSDSLAYNDVIGINLSTTDENLSFDVKVIGQDEEILADIFTELAYIEKFADENNTHQLGHDLFLPTSFREYNATISWWSSNELVMTNDGILVTNDKQGLIYLIATIKYHDKVYNKVYYVKVVKQDNLSKLQYLAGIIEKDMLFTKVYNGDTTNLEAYKTLPTADNYMSFYDNAIENLGLTEITYELENSYYFMTYGMDTNTNPNTPYIYLNQITFQPYARLKIYGKFSNSEHIEEAFINIQISLSSSDIGEEVIAYVQSYLNDINVLDVILKSRGELGIINENGSFDLPDEYMGVSITYETYYEEDAEKNKTYLDYYTISSTNNDYFVVIGSEQIENFELTERRIPLKCNVVASGSEAFKSDVYFIIPAAVTFDNFIKPTTGITSLDGDVKKLFYTTKYQTLQQSTENAMYNETLSLLGASVNQIYELPEYILIDDIEKTSELIYEYDYTETILDKCDLTVLIDILEWATGVDNVTVNGSSFDEYLTEEVDWIKSTAGTNLSDGEIYVIQLYAEKYPGFKSVLFDEDVTIKEDYNICIGDNVLSSSDIAKLLEIISDEIFTNILSWARGETDQSSTIETLLGTNKTVIHNSLYSNTNDGKATISNEEEAVIIYYVINNKTKDVFDAFYTIWKNDNVLGRKIDTGYTFSGFNTYESVISGVYCYDPVFVALYKWMSETSQYTLSEALATFMSDNTKKYYNYSNLFESTHLEQNNDYLTPTFEGVISTNVDCTSDAEWNILVSYIRKFYGEDLEIEYNVNNNTKKTVNINDLEYKFKDSYDSSTDGNYYELESTGFIGTKSGTRLTDNFIKGVIDAINAKYDINSSTNTNTEYVSLVNWANSISQSNEFNHEQYKLGSVVSHNDFVNNYGDTIKDDFGIDSIAYISYDEYMVMKAYLEEVICEDIGGTSASTLINCFSSMYLNPLNLGTSVDAPIISDNYYGLILNVVDNQDVFNNVVNDATIFINGDPNTLYQNKDYSFDNLPTISYEEYEQIIKADSWPIEFFNVLNNVITTYQVDPNTLEITLNQNLDRSINADTLIDELETELGYIPSDVFNFITINTIATTDEISYFDILKFYINLNGISFIGKTDCRLFETSTSANEVFVILSNTATNLERFTFNHTNLSDISGIENLIFLTSVDLRNNDSTNSSLLVDISPLLELLIKKENYNKKMKENTDIAEEDKKYASFIEYINIHNTDVDFSTAELVFYKNYIDYYNDNDETTPNYYYSLNGVETLYKPQLSNDMNMGVNLCYLLKEIEFMTNDRIVLPTLIFSPDYPDGIAVKWSRVSGPISVGDTYIIKEGTGRAVVKATITHNGKEYFRYFIIEISE